MRILFLLLISISSQAQLLSFVNQRSRVPQSTGTTLENNLIAYYKLDETSGNAIDSKGTFNGTVVTTTQGSSGKLNTAYTFDGSTSYLNLGSINSTDVFTLSAWIYSTGSGGAILSSRVESGTTNGLIFRVNGTGNIEVQKGSVTTIGSSSGTVTASTWTHVAVTYSASGVYTYYINGSASGTGTNVQTFSQTAWGMGARRIGTDYFTGRIDEVAIYSRDLTGTEIAQLYNSGSGLPYPFVPPAPPTYDTTYGTASQFNMHTSQPAISGWADFDQSGSVPQNIVKTATQNGITLNTNTTAAWKPFGGNTSNITVGQDASDGGGFHFPANVIVAGYYSTSGAFGGTTAECNFRVSGATPDSLYEIQLLPSFKNGLLGYNSDMQAKLIDRDGTTTYTTFMDGSNRGATTTGVMITGNTSKYIRMFGRANSSGYLYIWIGGTTNAGNGNNLGAANAISIRKATITPIP